MSACLTSVFITLLFASFVYSRNRPRGRQPHRPARSVMRWWTLSLRSATTSPA